MHTCANKAVENCKSGQASEGGDGGPGVEKETGCEDEGNERVKGPEIAVSEKSWQDAAGQAETVDYEEDGERGGGGDVDNVCCESRNLAIGERLRDASGKMKRMHDITAVA